jgi:CelD/BcsL family acetyltransferase involved in cellulose biosynthesis
MNKISSIRHIQDLKGFEGLQESWNRLLRQRTEKTVFLTWEWLYSWWKHNQEGKTLWLLTAWQEENLIGIAPLMLCHTIKHGMPFRLLQTLGTPNTDQSDFIALNDDPEIVASLCNHILSQRKQWDAIELNEHEDEDPKTHQICNLLSDGGLILKVNSNLHHHIPITGTWDEYLKSLSKNMRRDIEKSIRHAKENHTIELKCFRGTDVNWNHFETFFEVNKNGSFSEKYESEKERAVHRELFELMSGKNWIEIVLLYLDGKPVAYEYGFNSEGRFEDWRTGYDRGYAEQAAGKVLLILLLKELFEQGYRDFDFLRGEYEHKDRWKPSSRKFLNIIAVRPTLLPALISLIFIPKVWQWLKTNILNKQGGHN